MIAMLLTLPALLTLALPPAPAAPAGPGAILAMQKGLFAAIDRGDAAAAQAFVAPDRKGPGGMTSLFLVDRSGAAIRATDAQAAKELLAKLAAESKAAGGSFETKITGESAECPSSEVSYAAIEFERVHTVDGKTTKRAYRGTLLVRWEEDAWKIAHWHVSAGPPAQ
jgi:SnoaL-like domain